MKHSATKRSLTVPGDLIHRIINGNAVVFVGAGLSVGAGFPNWPTALRQLLDWGAANGVDLKNRRQLQGLITKNELVLVAEELQALFTKAQFQQAMHSVFRKPASTPTPVHLSLTEIPFVAALTSNYDTLLESAYTKKLGNQPPVFTSAQPKDLGWAMRGENFHIVKVHGTIDQIDSVVLGRKDYRRVMHSNPAYRRYMDMTFGSRTVLFLGFSLEDPDIQMILDHLRADFQDYSGPHYALLPTGRSPNIKQEALKRDFAVHPITYRPSASSHPEVHDFITLLRDEVALAMGPASPIQRFLRTQHSLAQELHDIEQSKDTVSPQEYLRKRFEFAKVQWSTGNRRSAWTTLQGVFSRECEQLPPRDRVDMAAELSEMMINDQQPNAAIHVLRPILQSVRQSSDTAVGFRFWKAWSDCLIQNYAYDEAVEALQQARDLAPDQQQRDMLEVRLAELVLLHGEFLPTPQSAVPEVSQK